MPNQYETKLQQDCYTWFHNSFPSFRGLLWRVENEGRRNGYEQMVAKSTGIVSGVSDLMMVFGGQFHAIELKAGEDGRQSREQKKWQNKITEAGGNYYLVYTLEEFQGLIQTITKTKKQP